MKRSLVFVLLMLFGNTIYSQNLIVNCQFEEWSKINKPYGWSHAENCLKDSSSAFLGKYSCRHSGGASSTSDLGQTIPVIPGKEYILSGYYKTIITLTGNGARIWCYWKDADGISLSDEATDNILRPSQYMKSEVWETFSITVLAPQNAASFYLEVRTYPNSVAYWDNFIFEENYATLNKENIFQELSIYPNPASNYLNICNVANIKQVEIRDFTGSLRWNSFYSGQKNLTIPLSNLRDGLYILKIHTSDRVYTKKFIKKQ